MSWQLWTNWHLNVSFSMPLHTDIPDQLQHSRQYMPEPDLKNATPQKLTCTQDDPTSTPTTTNVCKILTLKKAFLASFGTIWKMPGTYTIHTDLSVPPVQHACRKMPIEYCKQIEKVLQDMFNIKIITLVTKPTEWVSSITYPSKPDDTLCICLDPHDLNKASSINTYKAPTLDEISLSSAALFSKLDTKDGSGASI